MSVLSAVRIMLSSKGSRPYGLIGALERITRGCKASAFSGHLSDATGLPRSRSNTISMILTVKFLRFWFKGSQGQTHFFAVTIPDRYRLPFLLRWKVTSPTFASLGVECANSEIPTEGQVISKKRIILDIVPRTRRSLLPPFFTMKLRPLIYTL